jgi:hypothetical protein
MSTLRARIGVYALALLVCQIGALAAAPAAVCRMAVARARQAECTHMAPGETCPMHHRSHGAPEPEGPAWKCVCTPGDAALLSLLGVSGTLPAPALIGESGVPLELFVPLSSSITDRSESPRAPPPRA